MPKLTVAIPFYNDEDYIAKAISSILRQTFRDFTLLLIDDGSTDTSSQIAASFDDERIHIIQHKTNLGRPHARNTALLAADSEYFAWMDADDIALPNRLALQIKFMNQHPEIDICGSKLAYFHEKNGTTREPQKSPDITAATLFYPPLGTPATCIRLSSVRKTTVTYDIRQKRVEDYAFWADLLLGYRLKAVNLPNILLKYRYFERPTSPQYHVMAVMNHVFPYLGIASNMELAQFHTNFVLMPARQFVRAEGLEKCLNWLDRIWDAIQQQRYPVDTEKAMKVELRNKAERLLAVSNEKNTMQIWKKTILSRDFPYLLVPSRVILRKIRNLALGR